LTEDCEIHKKEITQPSISQCFGSLHVLNWIATFTLIANGEYFVLFTLYCTILVIALLAVFEHL